MFFPRPLIRYPAGMITLTTFCLKPGESAPQGEEVQQRLLSRAPPCYACYGHGQPGEGGRWCCGRPGRSEQLWVKVLISRGMTCLSQSDTYSRTMLIEPCVKLVESHSNRQQAFIIQVCTCKFNPIWSQLVSNQWDKCVGSYVWFPFHVLQQAIAGLTHESLVANRC